MGHIRLGTLPKTQKWNQVVSLITGGAVVERIAAASADAAEHGLELASQDEGLAHAFWLLTQIPQAARQSHFSERLWELGLHASRSRPNLLETVPALAMPVHGSVHGRGGRRAPGEMGGQAAGSFRGPQAAEPLWADGERCSTGAGQARHVGSVQHRRARFLFSADQPFTRVFPESGAVEARRPGQAIR